MNTIFNKQYLLATIFFVAMGMMTGCGDDEPVPAPKQTQNEKNPSEDNNGQQPEQPQTPEMKEIESSAIEENAEEGEISVKMAEQPGGRAVMTVTKAETKVSSQIFITGTYDNETGCYVFDLSNLEADETYQYIISVYNKEGQKVMESKSKSVTIPESADIDKDGSDGGADGMKGGVINMAQI